MLPDPMESAEQADAEAVERQDEARREQHYAEATVAARGLVGSLSSVREMSILLERIDRRGAQTVLWYDHSDDARWRTLNDFAADEGTPALLRVIATALEPAPKADERFDQLFDWFIEGPK